MARRQRPSRTLLGFFIGLAVAYGLVALAGTWTPTLGLDLQGGTRITLIAEGEPSEDNLVEASQIIDQRVNGSGVSEAEVTTQGNQFVVVEIPGESQSDLVETVERQAQLRFRVVACSTLDGRCGGADRADGSHPDRGARARSRRHRRAVGVGHRLREAGQPGAARLLREEEGRQERRRTVGEPTDGADDRAHRAGATRRRRLRRPAGLDGQPGPRVDPGVPGLPVPAPGRDRARRGRPRQAAGHL